MNTLIRRGLMALVKHDHYLLALNVNERSITHKLGMYYQLLFPGWDVDCEFNKNLGDPKRIVVDPQAFLGKMVDLLEGGEKINQRSEMISMLRHEDISLEDTDRLIAQLRDPSRLRYDEELDVVHFVLTLKSGEELTKVIYPDIIIHKRGTKNNFIVIEAKKSSNNDSTSRAYDLVKLFTLVEDESYKYKRGYFIDIPVSKLLDTHKKFIFRSFALNKKISLVKSSS